MRLIGIALLTALLHLALPAAAHDQVLGGAGVITGDEAGWLPLLAQTQAAIEAAMKGSLTP